MITRSLSVGTAAAVLGVLASLSMQALAAGDLVTFPDGFADGVRYAMVERGNIREEIFTSQSAVEAVKKGKPIPGGTVITLVDYRDGKLFRFVVMEKRSGWGAAYPPEKRNGEWEYQAFNADRSVNCSENVDRCFGCHKGQAQQDHVFTLDRMRSAK
jgi:hypothetical protein